MNVHVSHAAMTQEGLPGRERLREKLQIHPWLEKRQAFQLGKDALHCELYEYDVAAPTVLFLPGIGTYSELYAEMLGKLSERGFNVVAIDLPGHGYSGGPRGLYTVEQVSFAVSMVLDHLQQRFTGPFSIFGYS
ncbi:MAG: alpha/beta fold hydrolase, partial [Oceanospirillaceae bacterium]|nr:alpha/beta fold hydrolase [Oceanospirillaceae bacterium]